MALEKAGVILTAEGAAAFNKSMAEGDAAIAKFGKSATTSSTHISAFGQIATGALRQVGAIAVNVGLQGIKALGSFVQAGISGAAALQQSVANISTIKPEIDTTAVFKSLNDMQTRVPQTAAQLGESLYNIFSSISVSQADALKLTEEFARSAVGAGTSAETFGTAALGVMNAYGLSVADASHISDVFFNTINAGVVTGQELASSLGPVTQSAKSFGVSLDVLGGLIAGVTKEGGPAAQNINNLNNFLQKISTEKAQKQLAGLGVAVTDSTGKFRAVPAIIGDLKTQLSGLTEAEQANALQAIFPDAQARIGAQTLISQIDFVNQAIATNEDSMGSATAAYEKMSATFQSQSALAKNALTGLAMTIGSALLPVLTSFMSTTVIPAIKGIQDFASSFFDAGDKIGFLVDSINTALPGLSSLTTLVGDVIKAFGAGGLGAAFDTLIAGLPAVGAAFVAWITPLAATALEKLGVFATAIGTWIVEQAPVWAAQLLAWGTAFVDFISPYIAPALAKLGEFATSVGAWIIEQAPKWIEQLLAWGSAFVDFISPYIGPALAKLGEFVASAWAWIVEQAPVFVAKLGEWGKAFLDWISPMIPPFLAKLGDLATRLFGWIVEQAPVVVSKLQEWATSFVAWIGPMIPPFLSKVGELATSLFGWIGEQAAPILAKLSTWASSFIAWIPGATVTFLAEWPGFLNKFLDWIGTAAGPLLAKLDDWALQFIAWVVPMIPGFVVALGGIAVALLAFVAETAVTLLAKLYEWGTAFGTWIREKAIPELVKAWPGFLENLKGLMDKANTAATAKANEIGAALVAGIKAGIANAWASFTGWIHSKVMEIPAAVRKALGISSPSKVFADEVGKPIAQGIAAGIGGGASVITTALSGVTRSLIDLFHPPDTTSLRDALNTVKGTVMDLGTLLSGNSTSIEGDTEQTFGSIVDLTHEAWEKVRAGISSAVIDARATVDTATKAILTVTTDSFTRLRAASDMTWSQIHLGIQDQITRTQAGVALSTDEMQRGTASTFALMQADSTRIWGQIHLGITDQITRTQAGVKLTTGDMQKATTATWGRIGADAIVGWQKVKGNIETPVAAAAATVATQSEQMQTSMAITPTMQEEIFQTYRHVSDRMIAQLERIVVQIDNVTDAWNRLSHAQSPATPSGPAAGVSAPPGGSRWPGLALGGPIAAGMPTLVGERRPEVIVPSVDSFVFPSVSSYNQRVSPPASAQQIAHNAVQSTTNHGPTFQIQAQYKYQTERSLMQDVKLYTMLYPSTT